MKHPPKTSAVVIHLKKWKTTITRTVPGKGTGRPSLPKKGMDPVHKGCREEGPPATRKEVDPEAIRSAWLSAFGRRLRIDEQKGFYLDGRPISLDGLMLETNRVRKANGLDPVGRNPRWIP